MPATGDEDIRSGLLSVSTATLTTALFKRGLRNTFIQDVRPLNGEHCRMAGPAFTLRYIPAREDLDTLAVFQDPRHPQRHAVETIPAGSVMVIDSRGDGRAASGPARLRSNIRPAIAPAGSARPARRRPPSAAAHGRASPRRSAAWPARPRPDR